MPDSDQRTETALGRRPRLAAPRAWPRWFLAKDSEERQLVLPWEVSLASPTMLGLAGMVAVLFGVTRSRSPFVLQASGSWFFGSTTGLSPGHGANAMAVVLVWAGLVAVVRAWLDLIRLVRSAPWISPRRLYSVILVWAVPLLLLPSLFSHDVYSYAAQGQLTKLGFSPYSFGTSILGPGSISNFVDPAWRTTHAPYGPVFLWLAARVMGVAAGHVTWAIVGFRALAVAGVGGAAYSVPVIARAFGTDPAMALVLGILNPVVLFGLIGGAHNDAMMVGLVCLGVVLALRGRPFLGLLSACVAAAIKIPAALAVVFIGWEWLGRRVKPSQRVRPLLTALLMLLGVLELAGRLTHLGWGWLPALGVPGRTRQVLSPTYFAAILLGGLGHLLHLGPSFGGVLTFTRAFGGLAAAACCLYLLWQSSRLGLVKALGLALLAVVALGPVVEPWYLTWGIILLAGVADATLRRLVVAISVAGTFFWLWQGTWVALSGPGQAALIVTSVLGGMALLRPGWTEELSDALRFAWSPRVPPAEGP